MNANLELEALLESEPSPSTSTIKLMGMAKRGSTPSTFAFALGNCDEWLEIPLAMVKRTRGLGARSCRDHLHHAVEVELKDPSGDSLWFRVLAQVLKRAQSVPTSSNPAERPIGWTCFECWIRGGTPEDCYDVCK